MARDRILVSIGKQSATRESILASRAFGLSALTREQVGIARLFGRKSSRRVDKFEGLGYHTLETGSPLLDECAATFDCREEAVHDDGSRKLIVGQIVAREELMERYEPLIYSEEDY